ncbi:MAG: ParA family protein [Magnetococcales bacterium]|nr:ParA family protein [Magnetococcales bacterium]MBF0150613.1 ParA family protein [Magnetococcales bacterium]MBF0174266.1 ParA family protein [Magnetococcales bacterium]MBF0348270.1 ParA family protein [Magnetococcales bacterium]MBF0629371.1 ParA family protein [Magnetococcales bacterium]
MTRIYSVINRKGGVGKTTCAVNIAVCLAAAGKNVLLVDMDPQGNATTMLGVRKDLGLGTVYHLLSGTKTIESVVMTIHLPSFHFIMADTDLVGAEIELVNCKERERFLQRAIGTCGAAYDFIIFDCPPSLGLLTINALVASDRVIVPLQCEFFSIEGFIQTRDTIFWINRHFDKSITMDAILFNMFDDSSEKRNFIHEFQSKLDESVATWTIHYDHQVNIAPSHFKPGVCYNPWGVATREFQDIALHLIETNRRTS